MHVNIKSYTFVITKEQNIISKNKNFNIMKRIGRPLKERQQAKYLQMIREHLRETDESKEDEQYTALETIKDFLIATGAMSHQEAHILSFEAAGGNPEKLIYKYGF